MFVYFFAMGAAMFVYIFAMTAAILNYETLKIAQLQKKHICVFSRESWIYGYLLPCTPRPLPPLAQSVQIEAGETATLKYTVFSVL